MLSAITRRRRPTERSAETGYTLVEVVVALLISCGMVTAMFGVAISQKSSTGKADRRILANQGMAQVSSILKGYVTGCGCDPGTGICPGAGDCDVLTGPNTLNAGAATWYLDNSNFGLGIVTDKDAAGATNHYALSTGLHKLTHVLPPWFEGPPYNAYVQYTVSYPGGMLPRLTMTPQVDFAANWTEP